MTCCRLRASKWSHSSRMWVSSDCCRYNRNFSYIADSIATSSCKLCSSGCVIWDTTLPPNKGNFRFGGVESLGDDDERSAPVFGSISLERATAGGNAFPPLAKPCSGQVCLRMGQKMSLFVVMGESQLTVRDELISMIAS